jgi:hypothetical protein
MELCRVKRGVGPQANLNVQKQEDAFPGPCYTVREKGAAILFFRCGEQGIACPKTRHTTPGSAIDRIGRMERAVDAGLFVSVMRASRKKEGRK